MADVMLQLLQGGLRARSEWSGPAPDTAPAADESPVVTGMEPISTARRSQLAGVGLLAFALLLGIDAIVPDAALATTRPGTSDGTASPPGVEVVPAVDEAHLRELIDFVLADATRRGSLAEFWADTFPDTFDAEFHEPSAYHEYEAGSGVTNACVASNETTSEAFYCPIDQSISWDIDLLRWMYGRFGDASTVAILAHEWGHHVQGLSGLPTVSKAAELQADCYAGMYLRHLDDLGALDSTDALEALAMFYSIGDDQGNAPQPHDWFDADVHGDSNERSQAQGIGFATGDTDYCRAYTQWADRPPTSLADGVTLRPPPGTDVTILGDRLVFDTPTTRIEVRVLPAGLATSPTDAINRFLRERAPSATVEVGPTTTSTLVAREWTSADGARAPYEVVDADGATERGVADAITNREGITQVFVADDGASDDREVTADEALDALFWGYCDPSAPLPVPCAPPATSTTRPRPVPTPTVTTPVIPEPRTRLTRRELERLLGDRMVFSSCKPWRNRESAQDPFGFGARAAVQCDSPSIGLKQAALFIFPDRQSMNRYWRWRVKRVKPGPPEVRRPCSSGKSGQGRWRHGEIVCYIDRDKQMRAKFRWTDDRTNTYGILDGSTRSIADLYRWWEVVAG